MKLGKKQIYYTIKDEFEISERKMAYLYGISGFILASLIWLIF
jgi:hypothetical protein